MIDLPDSDYAARVSRLLDDVNHHTDYGGIHYPFHGTAPPATGRGVCRFCNGCLADKRTRGFCRSVACTGAVQGYAIGDVWYFRCWLGIDSLVLPIAPGGELRGALEVGGFFSPGGAESAQQTILARLSSLDHIGTFDAFIGSLQGLRELAYKPVKAMADFLMEASFNRGLNNASAFAVRRRISIQQQRLAAAVEQLQGSVPPLGKNLASLGALMMAVDGSDPREVGRAMDDFLGHLLLSALGNLNKARAGVLTLLSALFARELDADAQWSRLMGLYERQLAELEKMADIESVCLWAEELVMKQFRHGPTPSASPKRQGLGDDVVQWLQHNYADRPTLAVAAEGIGASSSSVVHHLKRETGKTFTQHLNAIRISEAKRLLAYTNLPISDVGFRCGFADQSYFTKAFRREINLTPGQFRRLLDPREGL